MDKLAVLLKIRTGETIPKFVVIFIKFVIPCFIFIVFIMSWINEFSQNDGRDSDGWTGGITWAGRLLWIVPILIIFAGYFKPIETEEIYDLIEKQYGIKFAADGSHSQVQQAPMTGKDDKETKIMP